MGQGKTHKRRQLQRNRPAVDSRSAEDSIDLAGTQQMTRQGRPVRRPKQYCFTIDSYPQVSASQEGRSCKEVDHMRGRSR